MKMWIRKAKIVKHKNVNTSNAGTDTGSYPVEFTTNVEQNKQILMHFFDKCSDVVFRQISIDKHANILLVYISGLIDMHILDDTILKPWISNRIAESRGKIREIERIILKQMVPTGQTKLVCEVRRTVDHVLTGHLAILVSGEKMALLAQISDYEKRSIGEPASEITVRGPRDCFTETLVVNTSLLRRKLRTPRLKIESFLIGEISQTEVAIAYMEGIAQKSVVEEVRSRIRRIQIDAVIGSGYIEELIEDSTFTPFPQIQNTERPDVAVSSLLEGKVAIIVDTTPHVLVVPFTFWAGLQSADDYYERSIYSTSIRWLRYLLFGIALLLPSIYVASVSFAPELLPIDLVISIAATREGVPFPVFVEALLMEFLFEAIREAGLRMPKPMGSAISIVGALVIGEASVQAGIVSAPIVIVVSLTGIASLTIPRYNIGTAFRLLRIPMLVLAGTVGFFGITIGAITILIHLVNLRSFGAPYFSPIAPRIPSSLKDVLIRAPHWAMHRPPFLATGNHKQRIPRAQQPRPKQ